MLLPCRGDLLIALRTLHEDHLTARFKAGGDPVQGLGDRRDRARDDPFDQVREAGSDLACIDLTIGKVEAVHDLLQEVSASASGLLSVTILTEAS